MTYDWIKDEMKAQGKTQQQMADVIGRTQGAVSNLFAPQTEERHRALQIEEVPKLAIWLGKSNNFILYGTEEPTVSQVTNRISILEQSMLQMTVEIGRLTKAFKEIASNA